MINFIENIRYKRREKRRNKFVETAINKMFKIAGHKVRYNDVIKRKDDWFIEYTMTIEQEAKWEIWFIKEVMSL